MSGTARFRPLGPSGKSSREEITVSLPGSPAGNRFTTVIPPHIAKLVPDDAKAAVLAAADQLLAGEWEVLGAVRTDMLQPDWFYDAVAGRQAPPTGTPSASTTVPRHRPGTSNRSGRSPGFST